MQRELNKQSVLGIVVLAVILTVAFAIGVAVLDHFLFP